jgi:hypothetical protein
MMTTPSHISADIRRLCRKIGDIGEPIFVDVSALPDSSGADCFIDVQKQVQAYGGSIQHGWTIWDWPGISVEGEFHAVWKKPDGQLLDITKKFDGETRILFAPDPTRVFSNRRVDTVRMAVGKDPRIKEWFDIHERLQKIIGDMMRGVPFGTPLVLKGKAYDLHERAAQLQNELLHSRDARRAAERCFSQPSDPPL